jgi:hypothetical protein
MPFRQRGVRHLLLFRCERCEKSSAVEIEARIERRIFVPADQA